MSYAIPISRVTFDGQPYSITPLNAEIEQGIGQHEQVTLKMTPTLGMSLATGAYRALSFSWGPDSMGRFFGYITDYTVAPRSSGPGTVVTITAMGPTSIMKSSRPRFFTNATTADVVSQVVAESQLGFIDEYGKDHYVWPQLAQTDESDWEFVNDMANREGSQLLCTDGVIRLVDPQNVLSRSEPVLLLSNNQAATSLPKAGLFDFTATSYSDRLPTMYTPTVAFLNDGRVEMVSGSSTSNFSAEMPVRNQTEATLAQMQLPVDWDQKAQARVSGAARIAPGTVLAVRGGSKAAKNEPYDGLWYVTDTRHVLAKIAFQTNASLARVVVGSRRTGTPSRNWWLDPRGRPTLTLNKQGNWISTWR